MGFAKELCDELLLSEPNGELLEKKSAVRDRGGLTACGAAVGSAMDGVREGILGLGGLLENVVEKKACVLEAGVDVELGDGVIDGEGTDARPETEKVSRSTNVLVPGCWLVGLLTSMVDYKSADG